MGNEEGAGENIVEGEQSPEDRVKSYVDTLTPQEQTNQWQKLSMELISQTRREVNGEFDAIQINAVNRTRRVASELYRKLGKSNTILALGAGLMDCIPSEEWEKIARLPNADPGVRQLIDYFGEKRKSTNKDPQES